MQNTIANLAAKMNGTVLDSALTWDNAYQLAPLDMSKLKRRFAPAGQSTQMIIGATGESDYTLLQTTQQLYQGFDLKRVFYSAYIPLNEDKVLPQIGTPPPLLREHRLYQADWLLRFYGFQAGELLSEEKPNFNELVGGSADSKLCDAAPCAGHRTEIGREDHICKTLRQAGFPFLEEDGCRVEAGTIFYYLRWQADVSHADRGRVYHKAVDRRRPEGYMEGRACK